MATVNIRANGDSTPLQWTAYPSTLLARYLAVDEGTALGGYTPNDNDYIETQTANNAVQLALQDTPATYPEVYHIYRQIDVHFRGWVDDAVGETDSYIELRLYHSGGTPVAGNPKTINSTDLGGQRTIAEVTKSWTGLSLSKAQVDSLELKQTLVDPA